jgi:hypothetical protein
MTQEIYHTVTVSDRHRDMGYCGSNDFGSIKLVQVAEDEAPTICIIKDTGINQNLKLFNGFYYVDETYHDKLFKEKQGRLTTKTAIRLMVELRKQQSSFSYMSNLEFILVGKRIYKQYCKKSEMKITQCGNTLFGDWWSLDVEYKHVNKSNIPFTRKNFDRILTKTKKWIDSKNTNRQKQIHFSYPKIKWSNQNE